MTKRSAKVKIYIVKLNADIIIGSCSKYQKFSLFGRTIAK